MKIIVRQLKKMTDERLIESLRSQIMNAHNLYEAFGYTLEATPSETTRKLLESLVRAFQLRAHPDKTSNVTLNQMCEKISILHANFKDSLSSVPLPVSENFSDPQRDHIMQTRRENRERFSTQLWWQEQVSLWETTGQMPVVQANNTQIPLLTRRLREMGGDADAALVRIKLLQGADIPREMRAMALEKGNSQLVKLLLYRQPDNLTLEDYRLAIKATRDTDFLNWIIGIINPTTAGDLQPLQSMTAKFTKSAEFMTSILQRTGTTASRETVIAAIEGGDADIFSIVWAARHDDPENRAATWLAFVNSAAASTNSQTLIQILRDWPQGLVKSEGLYTGICAQLNPEGLQLLLANQVPFPANGYDTILERVISTCITLQERLANARRTREKKIFMDDGDSSVYAENNCCKMIAALICLIGFISMTAAGVLYYKGEKNTAITRHSDDAIDDDKRQESENFDAAMSLLVIGCVFTSCFMYCFISYFCKVAPPLFEEVKTKHDITHLINKTNIMVQILADHDIKPTEAQRRYATNRRCPAEILNKMTAVSQQGLNPTQTGGLLAGVFGRSHQPIDAGNRPAILNI